MDGHGRHGLSFASRSTPIVVARLMTQKLSDHLGKPLYVEKLAKVVAHETLAQSVSVALYVAAPRSLSAASICLRVPASIFSVIALR